MRSLASEHPKQWDQFLARVEYAFNDSSNKSTGQSPFHIVYGMRSRGVFELRDLAKYEMRSAHGEYLSSKIQAIHEEVKQQLQDNNTK